MQTLKGRNMYSQLRVVSEELQDKNGKPYFRVANGKTVFTVEPDVAQLIKTKQIAELSLEEGSREVEIDGKNQTVTTLAYAGHLTWAELEMIVNADGKITRLEKIYSAPIKAEDLKLEDVI